MVDSCLGGVAVAHFYRAWERGRSQGGSQACSCQFIRGLAAATHVHFGGAAGPCCWRRRRPLLLLLSGPVRSKSPTELGSSKQATPSNPGGESVTRWS